MTREITDEQVSQEAFEDDEIREPRRFKVLLHNDDYTTMEFVIYVLQKVFNKTEGEAVQIMMSVHKNGIGICGIYTAEVAETKVVMVKSMARKEGYPLKCTMEEV
ncbi:ATP-dependent Clp protease adapter ClpS [Desulfonatronovibrio magnus]|uniref:ATP-dependent Clp protease adapter ClpS n=1 Tax=Desulfonatronovibrio magnus TaxID=698827 RepID=UPI0005EB9312|nr:ATP-dependent Clp protease adapter ClpS [Desulfonatronovibrio magnus]RQD55526.1 MAG: ATP-dependent Clp protease adapter ClpS [Desulfonatronovibrio sp. MSAO_Bac4]